MRPRRPAEPANHERWLVSYADFITLLFAFFVIMYATSQADAAKFRQVAESLRSSLKGPAAAPGPGPGAIPEPGAGSVGGQGQSDGASASPRGAASRDAGLRELEAALAEDFSVEAGASGAGVLQMERDPRGLVLRLAVANAFAPGESAVGEDLRPLLDRLAHVLSARAYRVRIEAHAAAADTAAGAEPWALSAARAAWVARYWRKRFAWDAGQLEIAGLGLDSAVPRDRAIQFVVRRLP
jgi:chemotaxis protein MotB